MKYQYQLNFFFRNGKIFELLGNQCSAYKNPNGYNTLLAVDNEPVADLLEVKAQTFTEGEIIYYNAITRSELYDKLPQDWDREDKGLVLIDRITINTFGKVV
jgi:hypothetical protein